MLGRPKKTAENILTTVGGRDQWDCEYGICWVDRILGGLSLAMDFLFGVSLVRDPMFRTSRSKINERGTHTYVY
jgi:hypothetical protein